MSDCSCLAHNGFLTRRGYKFIRNFGVDKAEEFGYLDKVCSVSALEMEREPVFDDQLLDNQFLRNFHHGS